MHNVFRKTSFLGKEALLRLLFLTALLLQNLQIAWPEQMIMPNAHNIPTAEKFTFVYSQDQFSVPDWMESIFQSQLTKNHSKIFEDQNSKFIILSCHFYNCWRGRAACVSEACGGITDRMWQIPYYLWLAR